MANAYIHKDDDHTPIHCTLSYEAMFAYGLIVILAGTITFFVCFFVSRAVHSRGLLGCVHGKYCLCCAADRPSRHVSGAMAAALGEVMTAKAKALADAQPTNFEAIKYAAVEGAKYTAIAEDFLGSTDTSDDETDSEDRNKPPAAQVVFERLS